MKFKFLAIAIIATTSSGCMTGTIRTDSGNFVERATIKALPNSFYNPANITQFQKCIEPSPSYCDQNVFKRGKKLNMQQVEISIKNPGEGSGANLQDFGYLIAAELAIQQGYQRYIITDIHNAGLCGELTPTAHTYGSFNDTSYTGTTIVSRESYCTSMHTIVALFFNDYTDIKNGVLIGEGKDNTSFFFKNLYFDIRDLDDAVNGGDQNKRMYFIDHPYNSWKSYFNAKEIIAAVRKKHEITEVFSYTIQNPESEAKKDESIESKYRVTVE